MFFDRPRLLPELSPYEESLRLYRQREPFYQQIRDECLMRLEHFEDMQFFDRVFLGWDRFQKEVFSLRLNPEDLPRDVKKWKSFIKRRENFGIRFF